MITYEHVPAPVRTAFAESHQRFWDRLAAPGTWWTGPERVAIAREARAARDCPYCRERTAALSTHTVSGSHAAVTDLPPAAVEVIHAVMTDAGRLTRSWYAARLADGLSDGHYVEIIGTIVALVSIDRFCRGRIPTGLASAPGLRPLSASRWKCSTPANNLRRSGTTQPRSISAFAARAIAWSMDSASSSNSSMSGTILPWRPTGISTTPMKFRRG